MFENHHQCKTCFANCYRRERSFEHVAHAAPVPTDAITVLTSTKLILHSHTSASVAEAYLVLVVDSLTHSRRYVSQSDLSTDFFIAQVDALTDASPCNDAALIAEPAIYMTCALCVRERSPPLTKTCSVDSSRQNETKPRFSDVCPWLVWVKRAVSLRLSLVCLGKKAQTS